MSAELPDMPVVVSYLSCGCVRWSGHGEDERDTCAVSEHEDRQLVYVVAVERRMVWSS